MATPHNLDAYTELLRRDGTLCLVGLPEHPHPSPSVGVLISKRREIAGSMIGGIAETQEMLDFCAEHGITSDIELIPIQQINEAYERMLRSDVKYRFVISLSTLKEPTGNGEGREQRGGKPDPPGAPSLRPRRWKRNHTSGRNGACCH